MPHYCSKLVDMQIETGWVQRTLNQLSLEQKVAQMLFPKIWPSRELRLSDLADGYIGGAFFLGGDSNAFRRTSCALQEMLKIPALISSDCETGPGYLVHDEIDFPFPMGVAATGQPDYAYQQARLTGQAAQENGINWILGPVVDINYNKLNPIVNTRSYADNPETVITYSRACIAGFQDENIATCAKHFPGDGCDDVDQHLVTSVNNLSREQWLETFGVVYRAMMEQGVSSLMVGHIALPAIDLGHGHPPPAPLSRKIITDFLRGELGWQGIIVTDAIGMGGSTSWYPAGEVVIRAIQSGCDALMFPEPERDIPGICHAVQQGRIPEQQIDDSVVRLLQLKESLHLHQTHPISVDAQRTEQRRLETVQLSTQMTQQSITLIRDQNNALPFPQEKTGRCLSYHFRSDLDFSIEHFDQQLIARGWEVDSFLEAHHELIPEKLESYDAIFVHFVFGPYWSVNQIRVSGPPCRAINGLLTAHHSKLIVISWGSPYHIEEFPRIPCYINAYSPDPITQECVLKNIFGECPFHGVSPVDLTLFPQG